MISKSWRAHISIGAIAGIFNRRFWSTSRKPAFERAHDVVRCQPHRFKMIRTVLGFCAKGGNDRQRLQDMPCREISYMCLFHATIISYSKNEAGIRYGL